MLGLADKRRKAQISLEFLVVYSFVLIIFIIMFALIATQRAATLVQQQYSLLQSQAQAIATYINQAAGSGNGYSATLPLLGGFATQVYNISISSTGVIILGTKSGSQPITAYAFSSAKSFVINGTLLQSANGISIYQLQAYRGSISIYNSKGIIYINQQPVSTANLAQGVLAAQQADVKAAQLYGQNGQNSYINTGKSQILQPASAVTVSAWIMPGPTQLTVPIVISDSDRTGSTGYVLFNQFPGGPGNANFYVRENGHGFGQCAASGPSDINTNTWYLETGVYSGTSISVYLNGILQGTSACSNTGINYGSIPTGMIGWSAGNSSASKFNGQIADVQVYNSALSQQQVYQLYLNGMGGGAVSANSLAGWWPLNGNAGDYSGYSGLGAPNSISYQSVLQLGALMIPSSNSLAKPIAGFVASEGSFGSGGLSTVNYTNGNSLASAFLSSNGGVGSGNVVVDLFNGNASTQSSLAGWWPLDTGYGNVIYDLSGSYNNGAFNGFAWSSANRTDFAAASFPWKSQWRNRQQYAGWLHNSKFCPVAP